MNGWILYLSSTWILWKWCALRIVQLCSEHAMELVTACAHNEIFILSIEIENRPTLKLALACQVRSCWVCYVDNAEHVSWQQCEADQVETTQSYRTWIVDHLWDVQSNDLHIYSFRTQYISVSVDGLSCALSILKVVTPLFNKNKTKKQRTRLVPCTSPPFRPASVPSVLIVTYFCCFDD